MQARAGRHAQFAVDMTPRTYFMKDGKLVTCGDVKGPHGDGPDRDRGRVPSWWPEISSVACRPECQRRGGQKVHKALNEIWRGPSSSGWMTWALPRKMSQPGFADFVAKRWRTGAPPSRPRAPA